MIQAIDHINVVVSDLERSVKFYTEVMGFEQVGSVYLEGEWIDAVSGLKDMVADMALMATPQGEVKMELFQFQTPLGESIPANLLANTLGVRHIGLRVNDVHDSYKKIKDAGIEPLSEPVTIPAHVVPNNPITKTMFYFNDPDGVLLEIAEYK